MTEAAAISARIALQTHGSIREMEEPQGRAEDGQRRQSQPIEAFLKAIEPFFDGRAITYVDVGAHRGDVLRAIVERGPRIRNAVLIEPNPTAFDALGAQVQVLGMADRVRCVNLALADAPGRLRLRDADVMTKVIGPADAGPTSATSQVFEIEATTLEQLVGDLESAHINLLKIDVEGFEVEVLAGAAGLLASQAIDVIYVEAGMRQESNRQTYYRLIEDFVKAHGYNLFHIFEQTHEWPEDSPLLRRVNLAFMSSRFAESHPLRLSKELFSQRQKLAEVKAKLAEREREVDEARAASQAALERLAECRLEVEAATAASQESEARLKTLRGRFESLESYGRTLEARYASLLESRSWRLTEPVRRALRLVKGKKKPAPFQPRLLAESPAAYSNGGRSSWGASRPDRYAAEQLIERARRRHTTTLLAREAEFASQNGDEALFLARFARLLALGRFAAYSEAAQAVDDVEQRLGDKHDWLLRTFGNAVFIRFVVDASTALSRVGRGEEAHRLVDRALARLDGAPALLMHRAELLWTADPAQARADLAAAARYRTPAEGRVLLAAYLDMAAGAPPATWDALVGDNPQLSLVAAEACRRRDDFPGYRSRLNGYFTAQGLAAPLADTAPGFAFETLAAGVGSSRDGPLVSVVMTTFNSAGTLDYALASIRDQSHGNLEILVVDDASTDATRERLAVHAAADPRIRLLSSEENAGTYVAKNRAIAEAAGDYVTLHDSDDWAHPERIARHVAMMEGDPNLAASRSEWLRATADGTLHFRRWGCRFQHANPASTFVPRETLAHAGFFDSVRYGADSEYWFRLARIFGTARVKTLPLCLGLGHIRDDSLTRSGTGAMDGENYSPVRGAYNASYMRWQANARPGDLRLPAKPGRRAFWAPEEMVEGIKGAPPAAVVRESGASAAPDVEAGVPAFVFGISLASKAASADWGRTEELLGHTLRSVLAQSDPRFGVVICGHERPALVELSDPRVHFFGCDQNPPASSARFRADKMRKRRLIGAELRARGGGYFFPLDADDLVHRDVVAHVRRDDNRRGYVIDRGYALDYVNNVLAPIPGAWSAAFDRTCGSSAVIWFEQDELPLSGDADLDLYFNLFQSHAYWPLVAEEFGRRFEPFPFAGGVYVVNHAQNLSFRLQRKGVRTENIVRSIAHNRIDDFGVILSEEFGMTSLKPLYKISESS